MSLAPYVNLSVRSMSNKSVWCKFWNPATISEIPIGFSVKTQTSLSKNKSAGVDDLLPALIEQLALLSTPVPERPVGDARSIWESTITTLLRLAALRLAHRNCDWQELLCQHSDLFDYFKISSSASVLDSVDSIVRHADRDRPEQSLSGLYEAVLNLVPSLVANGDASRFVVKRLEKYKKRSGCFYTPPHLVDLVVEHALAPLVSTSDVFTLKIVDPSMGAGVFLIHAWRFLCRHASPLQVDDAPVSANAVKARIASQCIYGVDVDPLAVEVAKLSLWLAVEDFSLHPILDFPNLRVGNSLIGARFEQAVAAGDAWRRSNGSKSETVKAGADNDVLNRWCSNWFIDDAELSDERVQETARRYRFFHWRHEFPEVFDPLQRDKPGFDAVIGNPPWEIEKPNSREFFGMIDPDYWTLGKQKALAVQKQLLESDPEVAAEWQARKEEHALLSRWFKQAPVQLDIDVHPFVHQGSGDINLYKLFCEQSYYLARPAGVIALLVPSGIYSDSGARKLRYLFLNKTKWMHLFAFENSDGAFPIHRSFKYCVFVASKGEVTSEIATSFMGQPCPYDAALISRLSPKWSVFSEVENADVLSILERIYSTSDLLGGTIFDGAKLRYSRELDMTLDSRCFIERDRLESKGYVQDVYGNWLSGGWKESKERTADPRDIGNGIVRSACDSFAINVDEVKDVFIPLYEGRMVGQFDHNEKHWQSGKGRRAVWEKTSDSAQRRRLGPQYLVHKDVLSERCGNDGLKIGFLAVGSATNTRTMIASCLTAVACGNSVPVLRLSRDANSKDDLTIEELQFALTGCLNSLVFDFVIRRKMAGNNLNYFVVEECPLPKLTKANRHLFKLVAQMVAEISLGHLRFCRELARFACRALPPAAQPDNPRHRILRTCIDVLVARLYGLCSDDLKVVLDSEQTAKGFFRIDRHLPPAQRLPAMVLRKSAEFEKSGLAALRIENEELLADERLEKHALLLQAIACRTVTAV